MKLTVNKNVAKLLEDVTIIEDKKTISINLLEGTDIEGIKIGYEGLDIIKRTFSYTNLYSIIRE